MAKSKGKQPAAPQYQPLTLPKYQPIDFVGTAEKMLPVLSQYADVNIDKQAQAQGTLTRGQYDLTAELAPKLSQLRNDINDQYAPAVVDSLMSRINQADPEFLKVRQKLGQQVADGLDSGYGLGDALSREVEQNIRKGQTARGNWLGPAPTAQEAMGKASFGLDLYNQRQAQANQFLNSRGAGDLFGAYSSATDSFMPPNVITPTGQYVDSSAPAQMATAEASNYNSYNNSLISAYAANTQAQFGSYDRQWDRYLYNTSVANGLYNTSSSGGGAGSIIAGGASGMLSGAMVGATMGSAAGGIGAIPGAIIGAFAGGALGAGGGAASNYIK